MFAADRAALAAELKRIQKEQKGELRPNDVVDKARDPKNPLHNEFEWDNNVCGEKYRLNQARALIASFRFEIVETVYDYPVPAYVRDPMKPAKEQGYVAVSQLQHDKTMAREAIEQNLKRVEAAMDSVLGLAGTLELSQLVITRLRQKVDAMAREVERKAKEAARGDSRRKRTPTLLPSKRRGETRPQA